MPIKAPCKAKVQQDQVQVVIGNSSGHQGHAIDHPEAVLHKNEVERKNEVGTKVKVLCLRDQVFHPSLGRRQTSKSVIRQLCASFYLTAKRDQDPKGMLLQADKHIHHSRKMGLLGRSLVCQLWRKARRKTCLLVLGHRIPMRGGPLGKRPGGSLRPAQNQQKEKDGLPHREARFVQTPPKGPKEVSPPIDITHLHAVEPRSDIVHPPLGEIPPRGGLRPKGDCL
jgi:hypothetical protein